MMAKSAPTLDRLPLVDKETGDFTVVLETPKGSRNKYRYDAECQAIRPSATMGEGLAFPYDFGFFPATLGDDGDPLDVLLFLDDAVPPRSVATARLISVLEVEQKDQGEPWERNDRFFAVATPGSMAKKLRMMRRSGPRRGRKLLKAGARAFKDKR
jgi:inorganic pyrophosphatase